MSSFRERVRLAVGQACEPFNRGDICDLMGLDRSSEKRTDIAQTLSHLVAAGELAVTRAGTNGSKHAAAAYRRTKLFRPADHDQIAQDEAARKRALEAQAAGAQMLQQIITRWTNERHAQAHQD